LPVLPSEGNPLYETSAAKPRRPVGDRLGKGDIIKNAGDYFVLGLDIAQKCRMKRPAWLLRHTRNCGFKW
jgi:hypothetical protein